MKIHNILAGAAILALGSGAAYAQNGPSYSYGDIIATFENSTGTDVEFNLGLESSLPTTAGSTEDFGNVSSLLSANGQSVSSTYFSVAADLTGSLKGGATTLVNTAQGTITALPNTIFVGQNNSSTPSFVGNASANSTPVNNAINTVGTDISEETALGSTGLAAEGVAVSATGDPDSYTNSANYGQVSLNLETTGAGTLQLWLLTSQTPGTSGKSGINEGPFTGAYDIGYFTLSSSGELTFTPVPEPSTYAAILGALTLGVVALRRRKAAVL
jgi:hypothetical protein